MTAATNKNSPPAADNVIHLFQPKLSTGNAVVRRKGLNEDAVISWDAGRRAMAKASPSAAKQVLEK